MIHDEPHNAGSANILFIRQASPAVAERLVVPAIPPHFPTFPLSQFPLCSFAPLHLFSFPRFPTFPPAHFPTFVPTAYRRPLPPPPKKTCLIVINSEK